MKILFKICLGIYTGIIGILIPITLFIKAHSFNRDYFPASFIIFILLLIAIFVSAISFQFFSDSKSSLKRIVKILLGILISIGFIIQVIGALDLFKETISSAIDLLIASLHIFLMILAVTSVLGLIKD